MSAETGVTRRVDWRLVPPGLIALIGPPVALSVIFAMRGGGAFEAEGTLVVAAVICVGAIGAARLARVHSLAVGALAGEVAAIGSLFYGGAVAGIPFAIAFTVGSGVLGGWWARRHWGERESSPGSLPTIVGVAALGAAAVLLLRLVFALSG